MRFLDKCKLIRESGIKTSDRVARLVELALSDRTAWRYTTVIDGEIKTVSTPVSPSNRLLHISMMFNVCPARIHQMLDKYVKRIKRE